ncbi:SDR family oxidoreductase [Nannocystaceae bacterium ST9]
MSNTTSKLEGKIVVVTGASRGLGRAAALRCAAEGALVAVGYARDAAAARSVVATIEAAGGRGFALAADLSTLAGVEALYAGLDRELEARTGATRFDVLINSAGIIHVATVADTDEQAFDRVFDLNAKGAFFVAKQAIPRLREGGRIILISSGLTRFTMAEYAAYAASKGAVEALTRSLAKELGPRGIAVNTLAPGVVDTDMNAGWLRDNPQARAHTAATIAMQRVAGPEEIGDAIVLLAGRDARWITGQRIEASGGQNL